MAKVPTNKIHRGFPLTPSPSPRVRGEGSPCLFVIVVSLIQDIFRLEAGNEGLGLLPEGRRSMWRWELAILRDQVWSRLVKR
jgi:hypothetical protein